MASHVLSDTAREAATTALLRELLCYRGDDRLASLQFRANLLLAAAPKPKPAKAASRPSMLSGAAFWDTLAEVTRRARAAGDSRRVQAGLARGWITYTYTDAQGFKTRSRNPVSEKVPLAEHWDSGEYPAGMTFDPVDPRSYVEWLEDRIAQCRDEVASVERATANAQGAADEAREKVRVAEAAQAEVKAAVVAANEAAQDAVDEALARANATFDALNTALDEAEARGEVLAEDSPARVQRVEAGAALEQARQVQGDVRQAGDARLRDGLAALHAEMQAAKGPIGCLRFLTDDLAALRTRIADYEGCIARVTEPVAVEEQDELALPADGEGEWDEDEPLPLAA